MRNSTRLSVLTLLLVAVGASSLLAHDTWILPSVSRAKPGDLVTLNLTSGMAFPVDDFVISAARVVRSDVRLAGVTASLGKPTAMAQALQYRWRPSQVGIATAVADLSPKTLTLKPALIAEYLDDIGADSVTRAQWARLAKQGHQWRELYAKHSKTFVRIGEPANDSSWKMPSGLKLEIIPLGDPTQLKAGDSLRVRVVESGRAIAGLSVGAIHESSTAVQFQRTDARGEAVVRFPKAGHWLLNGTDLRLSKRAGLEWESDFTTVTLSVR